MNVSIEWDCPNCDAEALDAEIHVTSHGYPAKLSGPPEDCFPGEGAEWELVEAKCISCGHEPGVDWFAATKEQEIQEKISEAEADAQTAHLEDYEPEDFEE